MRPLLSVTVVATAVAVYESLLEVRLEILLMMDITKSKVNHLNSPVRMHTQLLLLMCGCGPLSTFQVFQYLTRHSTRSSPVLPYSARHAGWVFTTWYARLDNRSHSTVQSHQLCPVPPPSLQDQHLLCTLARGP